MIHQAARVLSQIYHFKYIISHTQVEVVRHWTAMSILSYVVQEFTTFAHCYEAAAAAIAPGGTQQRAESALRVGGPVAVEQWPHGAP
jgi:hypothetical protein